VPRYLCRFALVMSVILITGGNGGLGIAIARQFLGAAPEHHVILGVRQRREKAQALAAEFPGRCEYAALEVTSATAWEAAVQAAVEQHGRIDVLVNNAGSHEDGLLAHLTRDQWSRVLDGNLTGAFLGCQAVVKTMMGQRFGRIVNISSLSALFSPAGQTNYAAAKAGLLGLTQSLAKEVARAGITVNAICPGYIETEALAALTDEQRRAAAQQVPMRRLGRPEEVASAVLFLASPQASYITGAVLKIDGGIL